MSRFNSIEDMWRFLDSIPMFRNQGVSAANFSLDNIRAFCEELGNPHQKYPSVHVAGTNGKGTTCYLLEKIYSDAGYKTGLFTSPHLLRYNERVRVDQQEISNEELLRFFQTADELFNKIKLSYFEISTALAFWFFAEKEVDIAIIEVGLGGRLDSTNIITPEVSVITSIGLDHQNVLGNTLEEIAREKAGIVKKEKPVILGNVTGEVRKVIGQIAVQHQSKIFNADELESEWDSGTLRLNKENVSIKTTFLEAINKWNISCVWLVTEVLYQQFPVSRDQLIQSIRTFEGVPARFEKIHPKYDWYFSGSHNIQALESSLQAINQLKPVSETILVFSAMKDKLNPELFTHLKGFKKAYFVQQEGERAVKMEDVQNEINVTELNEDEKEIILNELKTELVIFMGSFYFYPIVKRWTTNVP